MSSVASERFSVRHRHLDQSDVFDPPGEPTEHPFAQTAMVVASAVSTINSTRLAYSYESGDASLYGAFLVKEFQGGASSLVSLVSLFDLKTCFFGPTRASFGPARAGADKVAFHQPFGKRCHIGQEG